MNIEQSLLLGILKLADFGLAREYQEHKVFTSVVSSDISPSHWI